MNTVVVVLVVVAVLAVLAVLSFKIVNAQSTNSCSSREVPS